MSREGTKIKIEKLGVANEWELELLARFLSLHCFLFLRGRRLADLIGDF